jgi:hypothetical protein
MLDQREDSTQIVSFKSLLSIMKPKVRHDGTVQILTDIEKYREHENSISHTLSECGFKLVTDQNAKIYFPSTWVGSQLNNNKKVLQLKIKNAS